MQGITVAVVNLALFQHLPDTPDLISAGEKSDSGSAPDAQLGNSQRRKQSELRGVYPPAGFQHQALPLDILSRLTYILPRTVVCIDQNGVAGSFGPFLHDHGIRRIRHLCSGHDAYTLALTQLPGEWSARECCADHLQFCSALSGQIFAAQSVAVHCRVAMSRDIHRGYDRLGKYAPQSIP